MLDFKNTVKERQNDFDWLISRLDTVAESICEIGDLSVTTSKTRKAREKRKEKKKGTEYPRTVG